MTYDEIISIMLNVVVAFVYKRVGTLVVIAAISAAICVALPIKCMPPAHYFFLGVYFDCLFFFFDHVIF